jgi:hypothetical protein
MEGPARRECVSDSGQCFHCTQCTTVFCIPCTLRTPRTPCTYHTPSLLHATAPLLSCCPIELSRRQFSKLTVRTLVFKTDFETCKPTLVRTSLHNIVLKMDVLQTAGARGEPGRFSGWPIWFPAVTGGPMLRISVLSAFVFPEIAILRVQMMLGGADHGPTAQREECGSALHAPLTYCPPFVPYHLLLSAPYHP